MESATRVQILDVSVCANAFGNGMNPSVLPAASFR